MTLVPCVGGIVHDGRGRLLVVRRGRPPGQGLWSVPGGRLEPGETHAEAVAREVREETDIDIAVGDLVGIVERPGPANTTYLIHDYRGTPLEDREPAAGDDAVEARWVTREQLAELATTPGLIEALREWDCMPR